MFISFGVHSSQLGVFAYLLLGASIFCYRKGKPVFGGGRKRAFEERMEFLQLLRFDFWVFPGCLLGVGKYFEKLFIYHGDKEKCYYPDKRYRPE